MKQQEYFLCVKKKKNLVMGDFKTLLHEASQLYESFVLNQWFGARIKPPKSRPPVVNH